MGKKGVAEKAESPDISEIPEGLKPFLATRLRLLNPDAEPYSAKGAGLLFGGLSPSSALQSLNRLCDLGLLISAKGEVKAGSHIPPTTYFTFSDAGIAMREFLQKKGDSSSQLPPELSDEKLTPAEQAFFLRLDPERGACSINEIAEDLGMGKENVRNLLKPLVKQGLMDPPETSERGSPKELFYKLSTRGEQYQTFLKDQPDTGLFSSEEKVSPEERAKKWIEDTYNWFQRLVIATVHKVYLEREKELSESEEVGERALCFAKKITLLLEEGGHGRYSSINDNVRNCLNAAGGAGMLMVRPYHEMKDRDMPLYDEPPAPKQLVRLLVVGIRLEYLDLIRSVAEGKCGGFTEPEKEKPKLQKTTQERRLEELLSRPKIRIDEGHEELSAGALEIYTFLLKRDSHSYMRPAFVRDYAGSATETEVHDQIEELVKAGRVEVGAGGIVKVPSRR